MTHRHRIQPWILDCAILGVLVGVLAKSASGDDALTAAEIAAIVEPFYADKPYLGLVVGVVDAHGSRLEMFGQVEFQGERRPPDENTLFEIGSITKTFTATVLQSMVESAEVRLDDPVNRYLRPEWRLAKEETREITLVDLATHTSGLPVQPTLIGLFALSKKTPSNPYSQFDAQALADALKGLPLSQHIGEKYVYSNLGFGLLGHALAQAGKADSYEQLLRDRLLIPLQLPDTAIALSADQAARLAMPHAVSGEPTPAWDFATLEACGGLRSTPRDMLRWLELQMGRIETPLRPTLKATHRQYFPVDRTATPNEIVMGLGWHLISIPDQEERAVFHNGGTYGSRSFTAFAPNANVGVLVLSNSGHSVDKLGVTLMQRLMNQPRKE